LPEVEVVAVPSGALLLADRRADGAFAPPAWRVHAGSLAAATARAETAPSGREALSRALDALSERSPWRVLCEVVGQEPPNAPARVAARIERLVRFWDVLDRVRYSGRFGTVRIEAVPLERLARDRLGHVVETWARGWSGDLREGLLTAAAAMARASPAELRARLVERLAAEARAHATPAAAALTRDDLERALLELEPPEYDEVSGGRPGALRRLLTTLARRAGSR
jgi:hypothetical protein